MKYRYIIPSFIAAVSLFVGCDEDNEKTYLDGVHVSQSYVSINADGGQATITIDANADWTFDFDVDVATDSLDIEKGVVKYNKPTPQMETEENCWVKITPSSGSAGTTEVTFAAEATTDTREIAIKLKVGDQYQNIIVQQVSNSEIPVSTVKDVLNGVDSKTYRVKGSVSAIANTTYGNWYLSDDEGNSVYVYGTLDKKGNTKSNPLDNVGNGWNIELGDVVTIEGPRSTYGTTIELVDVKVLKVEKALLKSKSTQKTIEKAAGSFELALSQKGKGLAFATDCNWLKFESNGYTVNKDGNLVFTISAEENTTGEIRSANVIFESTDGDNKTRLQIPVKQLSSEVVIGDEATLASLAPKMASAAKSAPFRFYVELKDAKVTYKNGSNIFLEDPTGGLLVYSSDVKLNIGDVINGKVYGSGYGYNNLPEATEFFTELSTVTEGEAPKPAVVTLAELAANFDKYISRYVRVENVTVETSIDVNYEKIISAGSVTDGTNSFKLNHQSTGKYNKNKIYYFAKAEQNAQISFTCIPSVNKANKQLNIWTSDWFK